MRTWAIFGGVPGNLALLDPSADLATNVMHRILDPTARLFDDAQHVLDAFLAESEIHYSVVTAIAHGEHTWSGITKRIGKTAGSLSRPMAWLLEMDFVSRVVPITEPVPDKSRRALYRITDPYLAFWHRFVSPLLQAGMPSTLRPEELWRTLIAPRLDDWFGPWFEEACRIWVGHSTRLPFQPLRVGEWWSADASEQIDIVATSGDGDLLLGECKWGQASMADLATLRRKADSLLATLRGVTRVHFALFAGRGLADEAVKAEVSAGKALLFSAEDLLVGTRP